MFLFKETFNKVILNRYKLKRKLNIVKTMLYTTEIGV